MMTLSHVNCHRFICPRFRRKKGTDNSDLKIKILWVIQSKDPCCLGQKAEVYDEFKKFKIKKNNNKRYKWGNYFLQRSILDGTK